ncbi:MAG: PEP-CTERM sorting domain-containing protein [Microcystaceae cyanobacterium]
MNRTALISLSTFGLTTSLLMGQSAYAGVIRQATISTTAGNTSGNSNQIVDQSGLSSNYISGATDFDTFVAATTHDGSSFSSTGWLADSVDWTADFDLGASYEIDRLAIWNVDATGSLRGFTLEASTTSDFSSPIALGSFSVNNGTDFPNYPAQTFTFAPTTAQFFRFSNTSNGGSSLGTGLAEVAFGESDGTPPPPTTPEPSTLLGLIGVGLLRVVTGKRK